MFLYIRTGPRFSCTSPEPEVALEEAEEEQEGNPTLLTESQIQRAGKWLTKERIEHIYTHAI